MTNEAAKKYIEVEIKRILHEVHTDDLKSTIEVQSRVHALEIAIEALEKQEKYRWHDLRENPHDLPDIEKQYLIYALCQDFFKNDYLVSKYYGKGEHCQGFYEFPDGVWEAHDFECEVIAWREIEPFEEE